MVKVLVIGAGALGQVFGVRLAAGGAKVGYLVRPGRESWGGGSLYRLRRGRAPVHERLEPYEVMSEARDEHWDMVWLCVDSTALRGTWTAALRAATGAATVVTIGQDPGDLSTLAEVWPREQIVQVIPALLAYQAPLGGEVPGPGVAYWVPPGSAMGVAGERAPQVVAALRAGGLRARPVTRAGAAELTAARMIPYIAALEISGWRLPLKGARLRAAGAAAREAVAVVSARHGRRALASVPSWAVGPALRVLPWLLPFDLRRYLEAHFTKVRAQTRLMLAGWIAEGEARTLPVGALSALRRALPA
jgi:2-dehydropantoate 2-reductase